MEIASVKTNKIEEKKEFEHSIAQSVATFPKLSTWHNKLNNSLANVNFSHTEQELLSHIDKLVINFEKAELIYEKLDICINLYEHIKDECFTRKEIHSNQKLKSALDWLYEKTIRLISILCNLNTIKEVTSTFIEKLKLYRLIDSKFLPNYLPNDLSLPIDNEHLEAVKKLAISTKKIQRTISIFNTETIQDAKFHSSNTDNLKESTVARNTKTTNSTPALLEASSHTNVLNKLTQPQLEDIRHEQADISTQSQDINTVPNDISISKANKAEKDIQQSANTLYIPSRAKKLPEQSITISSTKSRIAIQLSDLVEDDNIEKPLFPLTEFELNQKAEEMLRQDELIINSFLILQDLNPNFDFSFIDIININKIDLAAIVNKLSENALQSLEDYQKYFYIRRLHETITAWKAKNNRLSIHYFRIELLPKTLYTLQKKQKLFDYEKQILDEFLIKFDNYYKEEPLNTHSAHNIKYLSDKEKESLRLLYYNGRMVCLQQDENNFTVNLADTSKSICDGEKGWSIYIINHRGETFQSSFKDLTRQHSSLSNGLLVVGAGKCFLHFGLFLYISDKSGHYRPGHYEVNIATMDFLLARKLELSFCHVFPRTIYSQKIVNHALTIISAHYDNKNNIAVKSKHAINSINEHVEILLNEVQKNFKFKSDAYLENTFKSVFAQCIYEYVTFLTKKSQPFNLESIIQEIATAVVTFFKEIDDGKSAKEEKLISFIKTDLINSLKLINTIELTNTSSSAFNRIKASISHLLILIFQQAAKLNKELINRELKQLNIEIIETLPFEDVFPKFLDKIHFYERNELGKNFEASIYTRSCGYAWALANGTNLYTYGKQSLNNDWYLLNKFHNSDKEQISNLSHNAKLLFMLYQFNIHASAYIEKMRNYKYSNIEDTVYAQAVANTLEKTIEHPGNAIIAIQYIYYCFKLCQSGSISEILEDILINTFDVISKEDLEIENGLFGAKSLHLVTVLDELMVKMGLINETYKDLEEYVKKVLQYLNNHFLKTNSKYTSWFKKSNKKLNSIEVIEIHGLVLSLLKFNRLEQLKATSITNIKEDQIIAEIKKILRSSLTIKINQLAIFSSASNNEPIVVDYNNLRKIYLSKIKVPSENGFAFMPIDSYFRDLTIITSPLSSLSSKKHQKTHEYIRPVRNNLPKIFIDAVKAKYLIERITALILQQIETEANIYKLLPEDCTISCAIDNTSLAITISSNLAIDFLAVAKISYTAISSENLRISNRIEINTSLEVLFIGNTKEYASILPTSENLLLK